MKMLLEIVSCKQIQYWEIALEYVYSSLMQHQKEDIRNINIHSKPLSHLLFPIEV